ncbi:MAG: hypothetical protein ABR949_02025 [Candidatus Aquilonibacter sp.]|jgi:hypothetical protein
MQSFKLRFQKDVSGPMSGMVFIAVAIDETGKVLDAARNATYRAPISYCVPVATTLFLAVRFRG